METIKMNNLDLFGGSLEELSFNEQQSIHGGSGITWGAGWLVGAAIGSVVNGVVWVWKEIERDPVYYMEATSMTA